MCLSVLSKLGSGPREAPWKVLSHLLCFRFHNTLPLSLHKQSRGFVTTVKDRLRRLKKRLNPDRILVVEHQLSMLGRQVEDLRLLAGRSAALEIQKLGVVETLADVEFKVFSQFGDDGIIQYLIRNVQPESRTFVEFGTESYEEANTRFLLQNDNWKGLIIDGSETAMDAVRASDLYWRHDLIATCSFITRANIDRLIAEAGLAGPLGLLSIDIDGNDY